jgi:hypothetical protein
LIKPWHRNRWSSRPSRRERACLNFFSIWWGSLRFKVTYW